MLEELLADLQGVHKVAVVGDGQNPLRTAHVEGLGVEAQVGTGGGVAGVPDAQVGPLDAQALHPGLVEDLGNQAQVFLDDQVFSV